VRWPSASGRSAPSSHLVEEQVGIVTPVPLALFWVAGALCTMPAWSEHETQPAAAARPAWWIVAPVAVALVAVPVAWIETRWLLASIAYAEGTRSSVAGRTAEAYPRFQRARALVPWLPVPAEATAYTGLRLAAAQTDPARRLALLREADAALAGVRRPAGMGGGYWTLSAQVAFARVRAGERSELEASLEAFEHAARLRPGDGQLLSQWAWALLEARNPARARAVAEEATAQSQRSDLWLAWAVLARAARDLGDEAAAERAAGLARSLAPPEAQRFLESLGLTPGQGGPR
jgi:tetratricopeptide (TPR) repeat protein